MASLVAVRLIGTTALGAQRWISIAGVRSSLEFAKIAAILLVAAVLARHPVERPVDLLRPLGVISVPWLLVFIQPDLGTSLVFGALMLTMLYWSGMPFEWLVLLLSPLITALLSGLLPWAMAAWIPLMAVLAYTISPLEAAGSPDHRDHPRGHGNSHPWLWIHGLKDYQRDRLVLFLDPSKDPLSAAAYHLLQSTVGIGSGGLFGSGFLQGQLTKLRFIPEQHTDFIFSALGEETGFIGCLLVVIGFALLMGRMLQVARAARTDFEARGGRYRHHGDVPGGGQHLHDHWSRACHGNTPAIPQLRTLGDGRELHRPRPQPLRCEAKPIDVRTVTGTSFSDLRQLLGRGQAHGTCDENGVRRLWWAALETLQQELLRTEDPGGLWLAAHSRRSTSLSCCAICMDGSGLRRSLDRLTLGQTALPAAGLKASFEQDLTLPATAAPRHRPRIHSCWSSHRHCSWPWR